MPKGVQNTNPEILNKLRAKVVQSLAFSLNSNKNYDKLSNIIFDRTGAILSNSTLRRVFQYDSDNNPTKNTLDLICKAIGFSNWDDFKEKEHKHPHQDLSQLIAVFKLQGLGNRAETIQILEKYAANPEFFILLDAVAQIAIATRDIWFLKKIFDIEGAFNVERDPIPVIYFIHKLVIGLIQSGLMPGLIESYGANPMAQTHLIESFVDEDNLNGYYYDLMQVYHRHKITPEARLFYHCLMYQHAIENNMPSDPHLDFIRNFSDATPVHYLPAGRRFAILLLEANDAPESISDIMNKTSDLFHGLNEIGKITLALYMVKLLFIKRKHTLIDQVLLLTPDISITDKNIDDHTNINQLKIYRAYSLHAKCENKEALEKLSEFDPFWVHAFFYTHIMKDYKVISKMIRNE